MQQEDEKGRYGDRGEGEGVRAREERERGDSPIWVIYSTASASSN